MPKSTLLYRPITLLVGVGGVRVLRRRLRAAKMIAMPTAWSAADTGLSRTP